MLGALIGAGASLVGGVMSRNSARKDAARARKSATEDVLLQLPRLKQSAIDAGFNPLTALTATGGQGFNPASYGGPPPLASTEMIVEGLKGVGDIVTGKAAQERAARQLDLDLAKLQMEVLKANALAIRTGIASAEVRGGAARLGRQAIALPSGATIPTGGALAPTKEAPRPLGAPVVMGGEAVDPSTEWSDAEEYERRYGEVGGSLMGLGTLAADMRDHFMPKLSQWRDKIREERISNTRPKPRPGYLSGSPYARRMGRLGHYP